MLDITIGGLTKMEKFGIIRDTPREEENMYIEKENDTMEIPKIPDMQRLRDEKPADLYERTVIDTEHPLHGDTLIDPRECGFADAVSYYAMPNRMTGQPLSGVENRPLLRKDVVERLQKAEAFLQTDPDVKELFGCNFHIQVRDAIRSYETQQKAFYEAWPDIIRKEHPEIPEEEIEEYIVKNSLCAKPNRNSPHVTGGAVDIRLVNAETGELFDRGKMAIPEAYEEDPEAAYENADKYLAFDAAEGISFEEFRERYQRVRDFRRLQYFAMVEIGGLAVNPGEIWHFCHGETLWGYVTGNQPYYGEAEWKEAGEDAASGR
jgi:D-alanyl-D-alanine dipeptidase